MKTKKTLFATIMAAALSLALVVVAAACSPAAPKLTPHNYGGELHGEKTMPAYLELKEDGTAVVSYKMIMGVDPAQASKTVISEEGTWTQAEDGSVESVKFTSNGSEYEAEVTENDIVVYYAMDFTTFTVSVGEKNAQGTNTIVFHTGYSFEGELHGEKTMPAFLDLKSDGTAVVSYKMIMGVDPAQASKTVICEEGTWTQAEDGSIESVKFMSNGSEYEADVDANGVVVYYAMDFTTFTVSVGEKNAQGTNTIVFAFAV